MKQILLPTDFSENSWNAISYALQLFQEERCMFHILNTYTPPIYNLEYVIGYPEQFGLVDTVRDTSRQQLHKLVNRIATDFTNNSKHEFKTYSKFNTVVSGIGAFVDSHKIDVIVMGTKGATGAKELLFGSNTVHVFQEIKRPILAIPSGFTFKAPLKMLFPNDLELLYKEASLKILLDIANAHATTLNMMHVSTGHELSEKQIMNLEKIESIFKHAPFLFHHLNNEDITVAIQQFQKKHNINFLVMINNKHSFFENLFFQNTVNQIGFHLETPFLVLPSEL
ncbi:universal stress protein [Winogradskyella bathintestinalis]|uniref:Universal stress protein n=1 Tax=Winogradskyella bathintestinalis TaxID=3035208 RepID=A0ABT7ZT32_9FLAO|nr:universal stress protein [Winogradskyella bathintestinalis]MDN3492168.1 universal stress protein [Winogradskyella bathintestinalis]